ncbi:MAG: glycosyltransferase family 1 protein [Actinomycetaceae bacterium]|nr:glycosyltransferase family 1 protein [Actinomycetaceae bacterium]
MPLRLAIVAEQLFQAVPGGSGRYIEELTRAFDADVRALGITATASGSRSRLPLRPARLPRQILYPLWNAGRGPRPETIAPGGDVVHATTWAIPPTSLPLAVTIHDLAFLDDPTQFTARGNRFFRRALQRAAHRADAIIVPSHVTAEACARQGIDERLIHVIPHGVTVVSGAADDVEAFRTRHGLGREPYLLWCGTFEPRKNLAGVIGAFALVPPETHLVLAGPVGWGDAGLAALEDLPASARERVHIVGRLSDRDLAAAYAGAEMFLFPSHREGFGLPVLESMAYGTPVVSTAGSPMQEFGTGAGAFVGTSPAQIAEGITEVSARRDAYAAAARQIATRYTWKAAARAHADVYRSIA